MSGRIRSIKPEVLEDEVAAALSDAAWRLWVSLWVLADDHGNVRLASRYLAAQVWQDTSKDVEPALAELIRKGRLEPYAVAGQRYGHIHAWDRHQRVDNAAKPRVPGLELADGTWDQCISVRFAEDRGEPPRVAESLGDSPLRARAPSPTTDHRPPTTTPSADAAAAGVAGAGAEPAKGARSTEPKARRACRLPEDWRPSEKTNAWTRSQGVDPEAVLEEFRDYWAGVPGAKGTKLDWDGTYRNRVRDMLRAGRAPLLPKEETLPIFQLPDREKYIPKPDDALDLEGFMRTGELP